MDAMQTYKAMSDKALKATLRNYRASTTGREMWWQVANPEIIAALETELRRRGLKVR